LPAGMLVRGLGNGQLELDWTVPATADQESVVELIAIDTLDNALRGTRNLLINVSGTTPQTGNDGSSTGDSPDESSASHSAPVFTPVAPQTVKAGDLLVLRIQAPDADGIPPALNLVDPPAGSKFTDNGDGTRTLRWQTSTEDIGRRTMTFVAIDHAVPSLTASMSIEIQITH
ncbi:MAG: cadherin repeat domain-containing protein, partial [Granulosicoccus sp.]|nr:cadherin repeat domain-containing protein [Granulosicoccus sp.]